MFPVYFSGISIIVAWLFLFQAFQDFFQGLVFLQAFFQELIDFGVRFCLLCGFAL